MFGWRPEEFWRATPAELACLIETVRGQAVPVTEPLDLLALQERFPDG